MSTDRLFAHPATPLSTVLQTSWNPSYVSWTVILPSFIFIIVYIPSSSATFIVCIYSDYMSHSICAAAEIVSAVTIISYSFWQYSDLYRLQLPRTVRLSLFTISVHMSLSYFRISSIFLFLFQWLTAPQSTQPLLWLLYLFILSLTCFDCDLVDICRCDSFIAFYILLTEPQSSRLISIRRDSSLFIYSCMTLVAVFRSRTYSFIASATLTYLLTVTHCTSI